jgi:hypothetical protein
MEEAKVVKDNVVRHSGLDAEGAIRALAFYLHKPVR